MARWPRVAPGRSVPAAPRRAFRYAAPGPLSSAGSGDGAVLRYYREKAGLSRPDLAARIHKSVSLIQAIELGERVARGERWLDDGRDRQGADREAGPHDRCRDGRLTGGKPVARCLAACQPGSPHPCRRRSRLADAR
jgi:hypothetical protein